jgi:hypothetical protein
MTDRFEALAEKVLLVIAGKGTGYTPPENAHMLVDTALAITKDFLEKLEEKRNS